MEHMQSGTDQLMDLEAVLPGAISRLVTMTPALAPALASPTSSPSPQPPPHPPPPSKKAKRKAEAAAAAAAAKLKSGGGGGQPGAALVTQSYDSPRLLLLTDCTLPASTPSSRSSVPLQSWLEYD